MSGPETAAMRLKTVGQVEETKENKALIQRYKAYVTSSATDAYGEELYCTCRKPDEGELMVACDGCDDWFHFKCMGLDARHGKLVNNFYCLFCDELFGKGKTLWKRKCRLQGCLNPILKVEDGKYSKYCSREHGEDFFRQELLLKLGGDGVSKEQFARVLLEVSDYRGLRQVGSVLQIDDVEPLPAEIREQVASLRHEVARRDADNSRLRALKARLNSSQEKSKVINAEIVKINNSQGSSDDKQPEKAKKKKGKQKRKIICGYDYSEGVGGGDDTETAAIMTLQDLGISEDQFLAQYESARDSNATAVFDTCIRDKSKCLKHSYWYEIKLDTLQNSILQNDKDKEELTIKIRNLIDMGWDLLENSV